MEKSVSKEIALKYIEEYFKKEYFIDEEVQPHFWDAVMAICENSNASISELIDDKELFCLQADYYDGYIHLAQIHVRTPGLHVKTVTELVKHIAQQIIDAENKPVTQLEQFLFEKRLARLEKAVSQVDPLDVIYR